MTLPPSGKPQSCDEKPAGKTRLSARYTLADVAGYILPTRSHDRVLLVGRGDGTSAKQRCEGASADPFERGRVP